ncbi:MAG: dephospho-CoA kinase [Gammaproteobacteria bacterium]|nr:dephospho-CoA kinase [Gammaproteobacteria bacterium]
MTAAIGLIGGIASGKSQASQYFRDLGIDVIDTDLIARELVQPGSALLGKVIAHFGEDFLLPSHELDRFKLRSLIFQDPHAKIWLENLLHPAIRNEVAAQVKKSQSAYCIVAIPLLKRRKDYPFLNRILSIETSDDLRIQRLQKRDQIKRDLARKMIDQQATDAERRVIADDVIVNDSDFHTLKEKIQALHARYLIAH